MEVTVIGCTNNLDKLGMEEIQKFSQNCARVCYTEKDFCDLIKEEPNQQLFNRLVNSGHHSVFEHINFNFNFSGIPKALAMVLNNEKQYATSEKSARYTKMKDIEPQQKEFYNKWMDIFIPEINNIFPGSNNKDRDIAIKKLAQENARYMTSVFTPTKMVHTLNLRQINFLMEKLENFHNHIFEQKYDNSFTKILAPNMKNLYKEFSKFLLKGMNNQTDREISLFNSRKVEEHFGDTYSTSYPMSFAGLAQAQRHRTINYHISESIELEAPLGFFIPRLIRNTKLEKEWIHDLESVAKYDFPQAQLIMINERGTLEDFRSKSFLRNCGHAQNEIMENNVNTGNKYDLFKEVYGENAVQPKCIQGYKCAESCVWGGKMALERLV